MHTPLHLHLTDLQKTRFAGESLSKSLYRLPITVFLEGDLGAGKTTFLQGFAEALGIADPVVSPTYALEQRYVTGAGLSFIHLDLYRLGEKEAQKMVDTTDDHTGIRCIEWADRLPQGYFKGSAITIRLQEEGAGREAFIQFDDFPLPDDKQIDDWRAEAMLPAHITRHCIAVERVAEQLSEHLIAHGTVVRKEAVKKAAALHDLLRFIDFRGTGPEGIQETDEERNTWQTWKERYPDMRHEDACAAFLREHGYDELAMIVETHGLRIPFLPMQTTEQKLLFYADKRVALDHIVTVQERFADFLVRYTNGQPTEKNRAWLNETLRVEKELFPEGAPDLGA